MEAGVGRKELGHGFVCFFSVILLKTCPQILLSTDLLPSLHFPLLLTANCVFSVGNVSETAP